MTDRHVVHAAWRKNRSPTTPRRVLQTLNDLLSTLNSALTQSPGPAVLAAFLWGLCSMVFSPCHLAGIPLIMAYLNEQESRSVSYGAVLSLLYALGMLLTIALLGLLAILAGHTLGDTGAVGYYVASAVFIVIGLDLIDVITLPWFSMKKERMKIKGAAGALLLGLVFGLAAGPCTFAFLAPILAVTFQSSTVNPYLAFTLLFAFGIGHCLLIVLAGLSVERTRHLADWTRKTGTARRVRMIFGTLLILAGLYFLYRAI